MTIHEYGKENEKVVILIHPSVVIWDYFSYVVPLMEGEYLRQLKNVGHGGLASLQPERLARGIKSICG